MNRKGAIRGRLDRGGEHICRLGHLLSPHHHVFLQFVPGKARAFAFPHLMKDADSTGHALHFLSTPMNYGLGMSSILMCRHPLGIQHIQCFLDDGALNVLLTFPQLVFFTELQSLIKRIPGNDISGSSTIMLYRE